MTYKIQKITLDENKKPHSFPRDKTTAPAIRKYDTDRDETKLMWFHHGILHREDGPAIIITRANKVIGLQFYLNGVKEDRLMNGRYEKYKYGELYCVYLDNDYREYVDKNDINTVVIRRRCIICSNMINITTTRKTRKWKSVKCDYCDASYDNGMWSNNDGLFVFKNKYNMIREVYPDGWFANFVFNLKSIIGYDFRQHSFDMMISSIDDKYGMSWYHMGLHLQSVLNDHKRCPCCRNGMNIETYRECQRCDMASKVVNEDHINLVWTKRQRKSGVCTCIECSICMDYKPSFVSCSVSSKHKVCYQCAVNLPRHSMLTFDEYVEWIKLYIGCTDTQWAYNIAPGDIDSIDLLHHGEAYLCSKSGKRIRLCESVLPEYDTTKKIVF